MVRLRSCRSDSVLSGEQPNGERSNGNVKHAHRNAHVKLPY